MLDGKKGVFYPFLSLQDSFIAKKSDSAKETVFNETIYKSREWPLVIESWNIYRLIWW